MTLSESPSPTRVVLLAAEVMLAVRSEVMLVTRRLSTGLARASTEWLVGAGENNSAISRSRLGVLK